MTRMDDGQDFLPCNRDKILDDAEGQDFGRCIVL